MASASPRISLDPMLIAWLQEDIGRTDRTTSALLGRSKVVVQGRWVAKAKGTIAGLPVAARVFQLLDGDVSFEAMVGEGDQCSAGQTIARISGGLEALLMGERVALNLAMRLSGIATETRKYIEQIADLPAMLVDTRKTTPGLRVLEKYAAAVGGARNHRMGLDDAVMIKENHIAAAGSIPEAIARIRAQIPFPLSIEVETETLEQVKEALHQQADIIMLDNMPLDMMRQAVQIIRQGHDRTKIEGSGNVTLENIRAVAETGVDYISSSAPITRSSWLDLSMRLG
ncbi:MAG: carboxylating nicotinate-nucleotide diphosphorylase [Hormoscilla sp. GM7CHS1pb]|nr:carboxylating nicotinate-nucleotide diphosphorylase [Hormoscilla sp. GM7CHS1pb]